MTTKRQSAPFSPSPPAVITPEMTVLDIIDRYRETEWVFKAWEEKTGVCICCQALFSSLAEAAERFGFDLKGLLNALNTVIGDSKNP
jgi:hypothetical protein